MAIPAEDRTEEHAEAEKQLLHADIAPVFAGGVETRDHLERAEELEIISADTKNRILACYGGEDAYYEIFGKSFEWQERVIRRREGVNDLTAEQKVEAATIAFRQLNERHMLDAQSSEADEDILRLIQDRARFKIDPKDKDRVGKSAELKAFLAALSTMKNRSILSSAYAGVDKQRLKSQIDKADKVVGELKFSEELWSRFMSMKGVAKSHMVQKASSVMFFKTVLSQVQKELKLKVGALEKIDDKDCNKLRKKIEVFLSDWVNDKITVGDVYQFLENVYAPESTALASKLNVYRETLLRSELIGKMKPVDIEAAINDAFKGADPVELETARRENETAKEGHNSAKETRNFFGTKKLGEFAAYTTGFRNLFQGKVLTEDSGNTPYEDITLKSKIAQRSNRKRALEADLKRTDRQGVYVINDEKERQGKLAEIDQIDEDMGELQALSKKAEEVRKFMLEFAEKLVNLAELGVEGFSQDKNEIESIKEAIQSMNTDSKDFTAKALDEQVVKLEGYVTKLKDPTILQAFDKKMQELSSKVTASSREVRDLEAKLKQNYDITDPNIQVQIVASVLLQQGFFSKLPKEKAEIEAKKVATSILTEQVAIQSTFEKPEDIARAGTEEFQDAITALGKNEVMQRVAFGIVEFKYKTGDTVNQPCTNLKEEDIETAEAIQKSFKAEKLTLQTCPVVLAAFEANGWKNTVEYKALKDGFKMLIAEELGVKKRLHESGVRHIVDEAYTKQMTKIKGFYAEHQASVDSNRGVFTNYKIAELKARKRQLNEEFRHLEGQDKSYTDEIYDKKLEDIKEEAEKYGISAEVGFYEDSFLADFWNSSNSLFLKNFGEDVKDWLDHKTRAAGEGALNIGLKGLWGGTKLAASGTFQLAMMPFRIAKYPLLTLAKPINLVRQGTVPGLRATFKNDMKRVAGYGVTKAKGTAKGAGEAFKAEFSKPAKTKQERRRYKPEQHAEKIKYLHEQSEVSAVEGSPFIEFAEYKEQVKQLDNLLNEEHKKNQQDEQKAA